VNETLMPAHVICGFEHFFFYPTECTLKPVLLPVYLFDLFSHYMKINMPCVIAAIMLRRKKLVNTSLPQYGASE
jgi:hypothetical protein